MRVHVHLKHQSKPVKYPQVKNAYQKGDLYCIMLPDRVVHKYPLVDLFRVEELPDSDPPLAVVDIPANRAT